MAKNAAPFVGAWIEILQNNDIKAVAACRTLRGCVD